MKKLALIFIVLSFINPEQCDKKGKPSPSRNSGDQVGSWVGIATSPLNVPLKVQYRRQDDLGRGNFAWIVLIRNDDMTVLSFTYKIEIRKGDGTIAVSESSAQLAPGTSSSIRVSGASIIRVSASDVKRGI